MLLLTQTKHFKMLWLNFSTSKAVMRKLQDITRVCHKLNSLHLIDIKPFFKSDRQT